MRPFDPGVCGRGERGARPWLNARTPRPRSAFSPARLRAGRPAASARGKSGGFGPSYGFFKSVVQSRARCCGGAVIASLRAALLFAVHALLLWPWRRGPSQVVPCRAATSTGRRNSGLPIAASCARPASCADRPRWPPPGRAVVGVGFLPFSCATAGLVPAATSRPSPYWPPAPLSFQPRRVRGPGRD